MRKLTTKEKQTIKAGKGLAGSVLTGIGNIFKAVGNFVTDTISTIATTVFMFNDKQHHDKVSYKLGANQVVIDDTKSNVLREEQVAQEHHEPPTPKLVHSPSTNQLYLEEPDHLFNQSTDHAYQGTDFT